MYRSTDDLRDLEYSNDGDGFMEDWNRPSASFPNRAPSPNTAALLAPAGCLTPAPVSRTKDGKPRVTDLNNLGLRGVAPQRQPTPSKYETFSNKCVEPVRIPGPSESQLTHTLSRNGRMPAYHPDSSMQQQGFEWREGTLQRKNDDVTRRSQSYISDKSSYAAPLDQTMSHYGAAMSTPNETVPPSGEFSGWRQEQARRAPENQEYCDAMRWSKITTTLNARHAGGIHTEVHMDNMGLYTNTAHKQEAVLLEHDGNRARQEVLRPVNFTSQAISTQKQCYQTIPHISTINSGHGEENSDELELDERRQKLMVMKMGVAKEGKRHKRQEKKVPAVEKITAARQAVKEATHKIAPHPPTAPHNAKENGGENYSKRKRRLICRVQRNADESCLFKGNQSQLIPRQTPRA